MPDVKRQTAYKCSVKMILDGNYIQRPGWEPNYIDINGLQISRINIMAVVVAKEGNSFTVDDSTGQIQVMTFGEQEKFSSINVGDIILLVGRPREYNQKRFLVPEIMKKIENSKWIDYRKAELEIQQVDFPEQKPRGQEPSPSKANEPSAEQEAVQAEIPEQKYEDNYALKIISTIRKLDKGDGANVNDVIKQSGLEKADKYIVSLINEGEIFEIRTGKIKILE